MESIQSTSGFHGWKCQSYFKYVLGLCRHDDKEMKLAGEDCKTTTRGLFLVKTNSEFPFAMDRFDGEDELDGARVTAWNEDELKIKLKALNIAPENIKSSRDEVSSQRDKSSTRRDFKVILVDSQAML